MVSDQTLFLKWKLARKEVVKGKIAKVVNGRLLSLTVMSAGAAKATEEWATLKGEDYLVLKVAMNAPLSREGKTVVQWVSDHHCFSFLPEMCVIGRPIFHSDCGVIIAACEEDLHRQESAGNVASLSVPPAPTEDSGVTQNHWSYWAAKNRDNPCPTLLGVSKDQRFFQVDLFSQKLAPRQFALNIQASRDINHPTVAYSLCFPSLADTSIRRWVDEDGAPILHWEINDCGGLRIQGSAFAGYTDWNLASKGSCGTPFDISHLYCVNATFPEGLSEKAEEKARTWEPAEEMVLFLRTKITNPTSEPILAVHHLPVAKNFRSLTGTSIHHYEQTLLPSPCPPDAAGVLRYSGVPYSAHKINGKPAAIIQFCQLLQPGECVEIDSILAHSVGGLKSPPYDWNWSQKCAEVKAFWRGEVDGSAAIHVPEETLNRLWEAGKVHLHLLTLGNRDQGPLLAKVGTYSAIGSESIPIIEFYDSIGQHDIARRSIDAFFDYQHHNGRINLYSYYDIETGAVLYLAGRHFAYTKDYQWLKRHECSLRRAADYLLSKRHREAEGTTAGLDYGTCADPEKPTAAFMLNAYNVAGLRAVAQMLQAIGSHYAPFYETQAEEYARALNEAIQTSFQKGPLVPGYRGRWVPTCGYDTSDCGLKFLLTHPGETYSHQAYRHYDSLLGPLWCVYLGILPVDGTYAQWLLEVAYQHMIGGGVAESQPFYSRHPEIHLLRGERNLFLNAFYSGITACADRDTLTFWEHTHRNSMHKTHEEGWALMQMRRMLWLEDGETLHLLAGIPDDWLRTEGCISIEGAGSYFGGFDLRVENRAALGVLTISWIPRFHTPPSQIILHLPQKGVREGGERVRMDLPNTAVTKTYPSDPSEMILGSFQREECLK